VAAGIAGAAVALNSSIATGPTDDGPSTPEAGEWGPLVSMGQVAPIHATLLASGRILMSGQGGDGRSFPSFVIDPMDEGPFLVDPLHVPLRHPGDSLFCAGHAHLADGRVLHVGGGHFFDTGLDYGILFDEGTSPWTPIDDDLLGGRAWYSTVTRTADGRMLVLSGFVDFGLNENRTIQLFDPASFDAGGPPWTMLVPHRRAPEISATGSDYTHTFVLPQPIELEGHLRDVVMIGKTGEVHFFNYADPLDPGARFASRPNAFRGGTDVFFSADGASSVLLADGRILIAGAGDEDGTGAIPQAHLYDPLEDTWRTIDTGIARAHPAAVLLPDTTVALVNGSGGFDDPKRAQIVDPATETVTTSPPWDDPYVRGYHNVALLLPDARVLVAGGQGEGDDTERPDLRIFTPPYLIGVAPDERPRIVGVPDSIGYGLPFILAVEGGPIHRVTLVAPGSMTHAWDGNQRIVQLFDGDSSDAQLSVPGPRDAHAAPPGDYLLFAMRNDGVRFIPSFGRLVRVR
jgi:hypothetical protein